MIIDGRTIATLEDLREFTDTAIRMCKTDPATVKFGWPIILRVHQYHKGNVTKYELEGRPLINK